MTDEERLELINEKWGNYRTETTKGMTELCMDFEWLLEQAEKTQRYEKTLNEIYSRKNEITRKIGVLITKSLNNS